MAVIENVELWWVKVDPSKPSRYQGRKDAPALWTVQVRTRSRTESDRWKKEFGMKVTPEEDDAGIYYKTSIAKYAFRSDDSGKEDPERPNYPINVVTAALDPVDPKTIGNGSIGNVSFTMKEDKSSRNLKGIQVIKLVEYVPREDEDAFEPKEGFEIIRGSAHKEDDLF